jgi:selenocysteine-specific elongation factor
VKSIIIGTAGHIDHGKSALVRALTGTDPDRWEEEKRRGITIDLGFAHLDLPSKDGRETFRLGFVDVPGHERFVRNMLAGVGGLDLVLLVISADEGIKPQTREHFDICRLLNIRRGITVLTKSDLVDAETLEVARLEVADFLRGSFLDGAPIVPVSALTGAGLDQLRDEMARIASEISARDSSQIFRLPIDRVFTMKGHGTVITGTTIAGAVAKEDEVEVFPIAKRARVRNVQVHDQPVDRALAGQRTALNLAGVEKENLARGMMLATPGLLRTTTRIDVQLNLLPSAKPLKDRVRVHFHCHTAELLAEVVLIDRKLVKPGESAFARLRLSEPVVVVPGDRFIVRQFSPVITIGGGAVLDAFPSKHKVSPEQRVAFLTAMLDGNRERILSARVARRECAGISLASVIAETGWTLADAKQTAVALEKSGSAIRLGENLISPAALESSAQEIETTLRSFHDKNPLVQGLSKEELRERLDLTPAIFDGIVSRLAQTKRVELQGELVRLAGRGVQMKDEEAEAKQIIEKAFSSAGLKVPLLKEVLAELKIDQARAQKIVTLLLRDRVLIKLADDLVFHSATLEQLKQQVRALKASAPQMDVPRFKDIFGITRKYAIPLLEYLDRERVTRRIGDVRQIL